MVAFGVETRAGGETRDGVLLIVESEVKGEEVLGVVIVVVAVVEEDSEFGRGSAERCNGYYRWLDFGEINTTDYGSGGDCG